MTFDEAPSRHPFAAVSVVAAVKRVGPPSLLRCYCFGAGFSPLWVVGLPGMPFGSDFDSSLDTVAPPAEFPALSPPALELPDELSDELPDELPEELPEEELDASAGSLPLCVEVLPCTPFASIFDSSFAGAALSCAWTTNGTPAVLNVSNDAATNRIKVFTATSKLNKYS